ncbi:hypothetical protein LTS08_003192 [Lithohypha guttulata]|nr:hypothetical protein LTS08_003192 [Lithohypha guttulata]
MKFRPRPGGWLPGLVLAARACAYTAFPSPDLRLQDLGQVAVGGDFDAISTYSYIGQQEGLRSDGTHSILQPLPNGLFGVLAATDANIEDLCTFTLRNGTLLGVIVAGNFTSIGGISAQSVAFIDGRTGQISPHPGIQGTVNALLCDADTETAYLGGTFDAAASSNAITWTSAGSWANLPFAGFDAPVTSITKAPNGHIVFGGSFTGLKNMTTVTTNQLGESINLVSASITSTANTTSGLNVVCPLNGSTTSVWELEDNQAGSWTANMRFGYEPSRLRLWNNLEDKGVRTWRFTALPNTGIMNFTYFDPVTGQQAHCDATCPLAQNTSLPYQDFEFVNRIGMNGFRIDVSAWYGQGGALKGIELFQNDTFVYAIESFNEPQCLANGSAISRATTTGNWRSTPSRESYADYLTAEVGPADLDTTSIIFEPGIVGKGNYTIVVYTPGCMQDESCSRRGVVNVTGTLTSNGSNTLSTQLSQTNNYEKYDQVYQGPIDPASGNFRPTVTITPSKQLSSQLVVAARIRFSGNPTTGGLNGLFDFDPNAAVVDLDFSKSAINNAGTKLKPNAQVVALAAHDDAIYSAGSFSDDVFENIMFFANNEAQSLPGGGLNSAVTDLYSSSDFLYVSGNFTGTNEDSPSGLENVAAYSYANSAWVALGSGLNGPVLDVVPFPLNITTSQTETVIGFSGVFTQIRAYGDHPQHTVQGFAVWVPSRSDWLQNLDSGRQLLAGQLSSYTYLPNNTWLGAGTLSSLGQAISGVAGLRQSNSDITVQQLPFDIESSSSSATTSSSQSKRGLLSQQNITGVIAGAYDLQNDRNLTILGGHFTARTNDSSIQNLVLLNGETQQVTGFPAGVDDNSTFLALGIQNDILFAGGMVTGRVQDRQVQGLVLYDLAIRAYRENQPPALQGDEVIVNAFAVQSGTSNVFVGGSFESTAQGLACQSVCTYDTNQNLWMSAGSGLAGTVTALHFTDGNHLLAAGNLTVSGNSTSLAVYDTRAQSWSVHDSTPLPGPVNAFAETGDAGIFWVAGTSSSDNSAYLAKIDGQQFEPVLDMFESGTTILGMQVMQLSNRHGNSRFLDNDMDLLVMGQLNITGFGSASAALFNGTTMQPFLLSVNAAGEPGRIGTLFSSNNNPATRSSRFGHSRGIAILVAFCAALGTIFLVILAGMILNRIQRKRAGYSTLSNASHQDKNMNINRVPPERLFASMSQRTSGAPAV